MENRIIWLRSRIIYLIGMPCLLLSIGPRMVTGQKSVLLPWKTIQYNENIIKVVYVPPGYKTPENISDAVILKPIKSPKIAVKMQDKTIAIGNNKKVMVRYEITPDGYQGFSIKLSEDEKIYGGGARAMPLNRRYSRLSLHNNPWYGYEYGADNLNFSVPFFQSSEGYGIFFDNPSSGYADIGKSDPSEMRVTFFSGELNFYIIFGNSPEKILAQYHLLTGRQALPPRWTLGNFMSRFGYKNEQQVLDIASQMEQDKIPFDGVIIDLFWFGDSIKGTMGNLDWANQNNWPHPGEMIKKLKSKNKKTILITEPFVLKSSLNYDASKQFHTTDNLGRPYVLRDFYFGVGGLIDIFRKDAAEWFWQKHDQQNKIGIAAWWGDLGEPEKHPSDMWHDLSDMGHKRKFQAQEVHNLYGHQWTKMLYQKYATYYPETRLFSLNRSGFVGSQRYNIIPWSGDVSRSWSGFKAQLPLLLGMSMCGIPYIHSDAGGFAGGNGDYELYVRWLQFAAYTPILRPHGTALFELDPAAYSFPSEPALMPQPYKTIARDIINLRYKLLPYNYNLAYLQATLGKPLIAPLYYTFPSDTAIQAIEDQYMWGESIMVVPITTKGMSAKKCILPEGKWYHLDFDKNSGEIPLEKSIVVPTPLEKTILFAKAGSFIPIIDKYGQSSEEFTSDTLTIHYYYDQKKSHYTLFDDDGVSKSSIRHRNYELLTFDAYPADKSLTIKINHTKGKKYIKKRANKYIQIVLHGNDTLSRYSITNSKHKSNTSHINNNKFAFDLIQKYTTITLQP